LQYILWKYYHLWSAKFRWFRVTLKSQYIVSSEIQNFHIIFCANYETTNIKNPQTQEVDSSHDNWHPWIKVLSQYIKPMLLVRNDSWKGQHFYCHKPLVKLKLNSSNIYLFIWHLLLQIFNNFQTVFTDYFVAVQN
jgi:hypothetical protein